MFINITAECKLTKATDFRMEYNLFKERYKLSKDLEHNFKLSKATESISNRYNLLSKDLKLKYKSPNATNFTNHN